MNKRILLNSISWILIILFLYTGITKLTSYDQFRSQIKQLPVHPRYTAWLVWFIPALEILVASLLAIKRWRLKGLYISSMLLIAFTVYLVLLNSLSYLVPCSCGGFLERLPINIHILFNISLAIIALIGIKLERQMQL